MLRTEDEIIADWHETGRPIVSIVCTTYNHEQFIESAIEGFLIQETDFPYEIIIHDDASTDSTQSIIRKYADEFPQLIRPTLQTKNVWQNQKISPTITIAFPQARGKYIAWCEGDDYWTDSLKLQKQVDFLEVHPDFSGCFHQVQILDEQGRKSLFNKCDKDVITFDDLAQAIWICTPSFVFRNGCIKYPTWLNSSLVVDRFLFLLTAELGDIKFLKETMAVYRRHSQGVWSGQAKIDQVSTLISMYKSALSQFYPRGKVHFSKRLAQCSREAAFLHFESRDYAAFRSNFNDCIKVWRYYTLVQIKSLLGMFVLSQIPSLANRYRSLRNQDS